MTNLLEDEEMSQNDDDVHEVMLSGHPARHDGLAMCDTCCAKTVAGESWMTRHMRLLWENGVDFFAVEEQQAFRFGPGNRIHSSYAVLIPLGILDFDLVNFQNIEEVKWMEMAESNAELMVVPSQTRTRVLLGLPFLGKRVGSLSMTTRYPGTKVRSCSDPVAQQIS